jgi:sortase A
MKKHLPTILAILVFLIGLSVLLYPTVSNLINQRNSSKLIEDYDNKVKTISPADYSAVLKAAYKYNEKLAESLSLPKAGGLPGYKNLLNISGDGIMGYIAFANINIKLPIYHGTDEALLESGVGHMSQTSLPVGGASTHAVITGHRGLPSAKLFTDLDKVVIGDVFYIYVLNEVLAYRVDQIITVEPNETAALRIFKGRDYVTCVTCTPYGINTHRLLIRGVRVPYESTIAEKYKVRGDANILNPDLVAPVLATPVLLGLLIFLLIKIRRSKTANSPQIK